MVEIFSNFVKLYFSKCSFKLRRFPKRECSNNRATFSCVCLVYLLSIPLSFAESQTPQTSRIINIALPDQQSIQAASPENFQPLVNFLKEYWQIWSIDNQIDITFHYLPTAKALAQLETKHIDIVAINRLDPRNSNLLYSIPYVKYKQTIFRKVSSNNTDNITLGIHTQDENTLIHLPKHIEKKYFNNTNELINTYTNFDAIYSTRPWLIESYLKEIGMNDLFYASNNEVPEISLHFTTRKDDRALLYLINENLRHIQQSQTTLWAKKYFSQDNSNFELAFGEYSQNLSELEKQYVIDHNVVNFPVTQNGFPPFVITKGYSNIVERGLTIDLMEHAQKKIGINFQPIYVENYQDLQSTIEQNKAQLLINVERNNTVQSPLHFSLPYMQARYSIVFNSNTISYSVLSSLERQVFAVIDDIPITQYIKNQFPSATFKAYKTFDDAITAVAMGDATVFIGRALTSAHIINKHQLFNLTAQPINKLMPNTQIVFAANVDHQPLAILLSKSINSMPAEQLDALFAKWNQSAFANADVEEQVAIAYRQASYVFFVLLLIAVMVFWVYYRQSQVRKAAQEKIEHALSIAESARKEAESSAQAKITFLARMSHEIRTPMNGVLGMTEALNFTKLNKEQTELLSVLEGSARHLLALLNDVLDFSKMDAGKLTLESVPINFHLLASNIINSFRLVETHENIDINYHVDNNIIHTYFSDPTRLNQVLHNLLSNAIKFTEKGAITLLIDLVGHEKKNDEDYDVLKISVKDTGIGISKEQQSHLFTPFIQADDDITRKYGGTGLGLSICQEIVHAMEGNIRINSTLAKGSEFYFELILKRGEKEEGVQERRKNSREVHSPEDKRFESLRVLIVEDNLVNVKVLSSQLARLNIDADIAYDGLEALTLHNQHQYDIIISDCHMPNMDGFELAEHVRKNQQKRLWLIAVTADALSGVAEKCINAGFDDYMAKPCPQEEITNKLNHAYRELQEHSNTRK